MECDRCGLATPKGKTQSLKQEKEKSISPDRATGKLRKKNTPSWLPAFLANSPLSKINIHPAIVVLMILIIPALGGGYYFIYESGICLTCVQLGGTYTTLLDVDDQKVKLDLLLYQYGSAVTGQVRFTPQIDVNNKEAKKEIFVENLDQITVNQKEILFQSKIKNNVVRVKFSGSVEENNVLKGNLIVTIPELNCNGRSFSISVKKS